MQNFQALGTPPPDPQTQPPQLRISAYMPATLCTVYNHMGFRSFSFEQFFLHRLVANLMMLTIGVCLIVFLFEKFYLHHELCDFDSILLHYAKLFIRQSIDREQIFLAYATGQLILIFLTFQPKIRFSSARDSNVSVTSAVKCN